MEYQSIAINFLEYGKFPYSGFEGDITKYNINDKKRDMSGAAFFKVLVEQPLILNLGKPPGYPIFLSLTYLILGNNPFSARIANVFMVCFMGVFMMYMGKLLLGSLGWCLGLVACVLYTQYTWEYCYEVYPNILSSFIIYLLFIFNLNKKPQLFMIGILLAAMMLVKGNSVFILMMYFLYSFYLSISKASWRMFLIPAAGFIFLILPWTVYANIINQKTQEEQKAWFDKINQIIEPIKPTVSIHDFDKDSTLAHNMVLRIYSMYAKTDGPIIITKQANFTLGDELISVHNELTAHDGSTHHEWRYFPSLYCNNHDKEKPVLVRIFNFYVNNPQYIYPIVRAKFMHTESPTYKFYQVSLWLLGVLALGVLGLHIRRHNIAKIAMFAFLVIGMIFSFSVLMPFYLFAGFVSFFLFGFVDRLRIPPLLIIILLSHFLITIIIFAPPRFIEIISPITVFTTCVLSYAVLKLFFTQSLKPLFNVV
jgi:4-amino-4-deoxy-L-arabinose transferase-like glycosyltransferase